MALLPEEKVAYRLVPFIRDWARTADRVAELQLIYEAMQIACNAIVTPWHWVTCAIVCSLFTRVTFINDRGWEEGAVLASQWISPKPYAPAVHSVVQGLAMDRAMFWLEGLDKAMLLFHDWAWEASPMLDDEQRGVFRSFKAATWDLRLLVRAAILSKQKTDQAVRDPAVTEA